MVSGLCENQTLQNLALARLWALGSARLWAELRRLWARGSGAPNPFFLVAEAKQIQSVLPWLRCLLLHCSLACVRREPWEGASGTCSLWTTALELSLWNLPPRPAPLFFSVPKATRQAPSRHLQTLPGTFGLGPKRTFGLLLHRSLCVRRGSGEGASGTCSPCTAALELSLWNLPPRPAALFPESLAKGSSGKSFEHLHFDTYTYTHTHWKSESIQVRSMPVSKYASVSMQA